MPSATTCCAFKILLRGVDRHCGLFLPKQSSILRGVPPVQGTRWRHRVTRRSGAAPMCWQTRTLSYGTLELDSHQTSKAHPRHSRKEIHRTRQTRHRERKSTCGRIDVGRPQVLHVVGVAVPVYEPRELLVLLLQPLRGDLRLLQQGLPLQLQEWHVQVRVQDLGDGGGRERERAESGRQKKRADSSLPRAGSKNYLSPVRQTPPRLSEGGVMLYSFAGDR